MNPIESNATIKLLEQAHRLGLERPILEFEFDSSRKYRADFAFLKKRILIEVEGWGHQTKERFGLDLHKYNRAAQLGWRLVRLTPQMIRSGESIEVLKRTFYPTPNYLDRCIKCLQPISNGETIHSDCFDSILQTGDLDNEFLRAKTATTARQ